VLFDPRDHLAPLREGALHGLDGRVRDGAENARAQFLLEAVHHRDDGDEGGDPERDAQHRDQRDERNEVVPPLGAHVAQTNEGFEWRVHGAN
jgi:hypothetical protein